ncbi:MAG TPA: DUF4064 domain-containing protein [Pyrinomonadaceae bacterium]|jgi:hypothetical protein|nr:DUF4064 domain-containing protein [Pyrinomonadaceae bacterium]
MTPEDHNKALGIMHLIYGGFHALVMLAVGLFFFAFARIFESMPPDADGPPAAFFAIFGAVMIAFYLVLSVPPLVAGYGLLKNRSWARTAGIVSAIAAMISFPFGTALGVYSLWFFFGEAGKRFYERPAFNDRAWGTLNDASFTSSTYGWERRTSASESSSEHDRTPPRPREQTYTPPRQPPNWRDE